MQAQTVTSKLTEKYQATIPAAIRRKLHLQAGDSVAFLVEDEKITLAKASPLDLTFAAALEGTLGEWDTPEDDEAWNDL